jgi:hypothetical protein
MSLIKKLRKLSPILQKREQAPKCGSNEEGGKSIYVLSMSSGITSDYFPDGINRLLVAVEK